MKPVQQSNMRRRIVKPLLVCIALSLAVAKVNAAEKGVPVGDARVVVPAIDGFYDLTSTPDGVEKGKVFVEREAQLMAFLVQGPNSRNYFIVKTPRDMAKGVLTKEEFRGLIENMRATRPSAASVGEYANTQIKEKHREIEQATGRKFDEAHFGAPVLIAEGRNDDVAYGYTVASKLSGEYNGNKGSVVMLMCTHAVLAQGKFVIIQMHSARLTDADDERVTAACRQYVDRLITANSPR